MTAGRALVASAIVSTAGAQRPEATLNFDRLQLASLGASMGRIMPSQVEATTVYGVQAQYGDVLPAWRIVFNVSYWGSQYRDDVIRTFVDSLRKSIVDPTGTATIAASKVTLYDVVFATDLRYTPQYSGELKPFVGFGLAAHVLNAEGKLIKGTFVERSLDDIAAGVYMTAGLSFKLLQHIGVEGAVRGDMLSGFRSTQVRAGASYYFGRVRSRSTRSPE